MSEQRTSERRADEVFVVERSETSDGETVTLRVVTPEHEAEMTMPPESALWLALELWKASRLPLNHNLRFRRTSGEAT